MVFVLAEVKEFTSIATAPGWSDEFLAFDVVRRLSLMGRPVSFFNTKSLLRRGLDALFAAQPSGMVATSSVNGDPVALEALRRCREAGIPAVAYGNAPELRDYDRAYSDHRAGSRDLTRWLLAHGRRRIVPFFPLEPSMFWETERIAGYEEAMREAGLEPLPCAVFGSPSVEAMESSVERFRVRTALAFSALAALRRDGPGPTRCSAPTTTGRGRPSRPSATLASFPIATFSSPDTTTASARPPRTRPRPCVPPSRWTSTTSGRPRTSPNFFSPAWRGGCQPNPRRESTNTNSSF